MDVLLDLQERGELPVRIVHNDTKINNVMLDRETDKAVCVIDLDTVMPGSVLYDFGDMVRTMTSPAAEDEENLDKTFLRMPMFEAVVKGYLKASREFITPQEVSKLAFSGLLITLETGIRFLTDYLEGDVYFKTKKNGTTCTVPAPSSGWWKAWKSKCPKWKNASGNASRLLTAERV